MGAPHRLGRKGEEIAATYLEGLGWTILERNYRVGRNEVDLIARRGRTVAFVEVKTRSGAGFGHPLEAITARKQMEVARVARGWTRERGGLHGLEARFDAIAVELAGNDPPTIQHVADAWRMT